MRGCQIYNFKVQTPIYIYIYSEKFRHMACDGRKMEDSEPNGNKSNISSALNGLEKANVLFDSKKVSKSPCSAQLFCGDEDQHKMRRVDWRWAAAKGFLNKDTNQWNEEMGGKEAYLRQRNERISARWLLWPLRLCEYIFLKRFTTRRKRRKIQADTIVAPIKVSLTNSSIF